MWCKHTDDDRHSREVSVIMTHSSSARAPTSVATGGYVCSPMQTRLWCVGHGAALWLVGD